MEDFGDRVDGTKTEVVPVNSRGREVGPTHPHSVTHYPTTTGQEMPIWQTLKKPSEHVKAKSVSVGFRGPKHQIQPPNL